MKKLKICPDKECPHKLRCIHGRKHDWNRGCNRLDTMCPKDCVDYNSFEEACKIMEALQ